MHPESPNPGSPSARRQPRRVGLSRLAEDRLKRRLRKTTCSEPWVEAQIKTVVDRQRAGEPIVYRYHDPKAYPPGGEQTRMIRCPACGVFTPPCAIEHGNCLDHADHGGWGPSPSAIAFHTLQMLNLKIDNELALAPADAQSLRREIKKYESRRKKCERAAGRRKRSKRRQ